MRKYQVLILVSVSAAVGLCQERVNPDALKIQDFENRIDAYMTLRKSAKLPRLTPTDSPSAISHYEHQLERKIREARPHAKQGDIFTPDIATEFRRLIGLATQGTGEARIEKSLEHAEPVEVKLRVNETYPSGVPLQSTPPTLIMNLPRLPKELEYRIAGRDLVIRDTEANLIVDFIPGMIP